MQRNTVLIIEEDPGVKNLAKDILELFGHRVLAPDSREEAAGIWSRTGKDINLVLFDVSGPGSTKLLKTITTENPTAKIIVTSTRSHEADADDLFRDTSGFLKKPYRISELVRMVERIQNP